MNREITIKKKEWWFIFWRGEFYAAFPNIGSAKVFASDNCKPGVWDLVPMIISEVSK